jgi:Coenzyme PQQ synthesis protein D (PqqD)
VLSDSSSPSLAGVPRPARHPVIRQFAVKDELVLMAPQSDKPERANRALALNSTGRLVWELCDGGRTSEEIVDALADRFAADREVVSGDVTALLALLSAGGFLEGLQPDTASVPRTTFVIGIEDTPYFRWQTAIFLESFRGKLPPGWKTLVVVCNNGEALSNELSAILSCYGTEVARGTNHGRVNRVHVGNPGGLNYPAVNRVEALRVAAGSVGERDIVCVLDSDTFLFRDLNRDIMPTGCALPRNWHIENKRFFSTVSANNGRGIDLRKLLEAIGCEGEFKPGGVNVFVRGDVAKNPKFIADCFRFAHALCLLGQAAGVEVTWMAEMPCFALAMAANRVNYELLERKELLVSDCTEETIPIGTIYHYYADPADGTGGFRNSKWCKQAFRDRDFLASAFDVYAANAETDHEQYFFELASRARERLNV